MNQPEELERKVISLYDTQDQLKRHIYDRADRAFVRGDQERDRIATRDRLHDRQQAMKAAFLNAIGGIPGREAAMNAVVVGKVQAEGYHIENIVYESLPGYRATANLYLPDRAANAESPCPAVLFLCGHEQEGKHSAYYHQVILRFVAAGLAVMAIDPPGQGERIGGLRDEEGRPVWGTGEHQRVGIRCYPLGESIARYFILDAMRAIDYMETRQELDAGRIGVTGNSGGGTQTAMMMVCDERIAAAAPGTFIMNRQTYMHAGGVQDAEQIWPGLTALGFDHEDLLLGFAPKPLLVLAAEYDFFPIEGTRRTVARSRRYWEMFGREDDFACYAEPSLHRYTDGMAKEAADFFARRFFPGGRESARKSLPPVAPAQLWCTATGRLAADSPQMRTLSDVILARYKELGSISERLPPDELTAAAKEWLREKVYTCRAPCPMNPRRMPLGDTDGLQTEYWLWWSQEGVMNSGYWFRGSSGSGGSGSDGSSSEVALAVWAGGTTRVSKHWRWIRETCANGSSVMVLNGSGVGPHEPAAVFGRPVRGLFGMMHKLADELIWLGDSLAALRTYDIIRCVERIDSEVSPAAGRISVYAPGNAWLSARLAACLSDRIERVTSDQASDRLSDWLMTAGEEGEEWMSTVFPGILQQLDIAGPTRKG